MSFWLSIITGSVASLIATIIWVIGGQLFSITVRSRNAQILDDAEHIARAIYHNLEFNKYDLAITYCIELYSLMKELRANLPLFHYWKDDSRKLFFTYLYQVESLINIARNLSIGGREAQDEDYYRCQKLLNTYFTVKGYHTVEILIAVLRNFNESKNYTKAFEKPYQLSDITKDDIYNLVDVNYFKIEDNETDILRKKCFTRKEYGTFLDKYFPKKGANKCKN